MHFSKSYILLSEYIFFYILLSEHFVSGIFYYQDFVDIFKYLQRKYEDRFFSVVSPARTRGNGHKFEKYLINTCHHYVPCFFLSESMNLGTYIYLG